VSFFGFGGLQMDKRPTRQSEPAQTREWLRCCFEVWGDELAYRRSRLGNNELIRRSSIPFGVSRT
jgi:hypothetical protein